jgi:hypothetical protein
MQAIALLSNIKEGVESSQEANKETFKRSLAKDIPILENDINTIGDEVKNEEFLQNKDVMEMLKKIDDLQARFDIADQTVEKYQSW